MSARYVVQPVPYGNTGSLGVNAPWCVVDTKPEPESFVTRMGATVTEERAPATRQVAFCMREGHANLIANRLNAAIMLEACDTREDVAGVLSYLI